MKLQEDYETNKLSLRMVYVTLIIRDFCHKFIPQPFSLQVKTGCAIKPSRLELFFNLKIIFTFKMKLFLFIYVFLYFRKEIKNPFK